MSRDIFDIQKANLDYSSRINEIRKKIMVHLLTYFFERKEYNSKMLIRES